MKCLVRGHSPAFACWAGRTRTYVPRIMRSFRAGCLTWERPGKWPSGLGFRTISSCSGLHSFSVNRVLSASWRKAGGARWPMSPETSLRLCAARSCSRSAAWGRNGSSPGTAQVVWEVLGDLDLHPHRRPPKRLRGCLTVVTQPEHHGWLSSGTERPGGTRVGRAVSQRSRSSSYRMTKEVELWMAQVLGDVAGHLGPPAGAPLRDREAAAPQEQASSGRGHAAAARTTGPVRSSSENNYLFISG